MSKSKKINIITGDKIKSVLGNTSIFDTEGHIIAVDRDSLLEVMQKFVWELKKTDIGTILIKPDHMWE